MFLATFIKKYSYKSKKNLNDKIFGKKTFFVHFRNKKLKIFLQSVFQILHLQMNIYKNLRHLSQSNLQNLVITLLKF